MSQARVTIGSGSTIPLATAITAISTQSAVNVAPGPKSVEVLLTGTGAISATINVYGAHTDRNTNGTLIGTLSPTGTTTAVDSFVNDVPWPYIFTDVTAISGTSASVNVTAGV